LQERIKKELEEKLAVEAKAAAEKKKAQEETKKAEEERKKVDICIHAYWF
jgi:hypothetical protein